MIFFETVNIHRSQILESHNGHKNGAEKLLNYGKAYHSSKSENSLFGMNQNTVNRPVLAKYKPYTKNEQLIQEKEVIGFYISGHPLQVKKYKYFCAKTCKPLKNLELYPNKSISIAGIVNKINASKNGKSHLLEIEDPETKLAIWLSNDWHQQYRDILKENNLIYLTGYIEQWRDKRWSFKVKAINLLENMLNESDIPLEFQINLTQFKDEQALTLIDILKKHPGKSLVYLNVSADGQQENMLYNFKVGKYKVDLKQDFFEKLEKIQGLSF